MDGNDCTPPVMTKREGISAKTWINRSDAFRRSLSYRICHKAASSPRRGRLFFVGVNQELPGFFTISAIEMKGEGRCTEEKKTIAQQNCMIVVGSSP
ncbi:hypothetical protein FJTKL_02071 [Diaporthe vaccinii]|uniref:Uncharacterized protein n=1 Tax=Diaporthe vaccinii TaxID=105482 RepID=A0ABR4DZ56_9PEZI